MITLKEKVQDALDEARTLILGTQVLLGFQYQSTFEPRFPKMSPAERAVSLFSLTALLINFGLLIVPAAFQLLGAKGESTAFAYRLTSRCVALALPLFALAIGIDLFLAVTPTFGEPLSASLGLVIAVGGLGMWFGIRPKKASSGELPMGENIPLKDKIKQALTETRVVLPGAQALLGFACVTTMMDGFAELPFAIKVVHLVSLASVAGATILLMTPAAIHRISQHGEASESFFKLASGLVITALVPLGLSLAGDLFVVAYKVTGSLESAAALGLAVLMMLGVMWFLGPLLLSSRREDRS